MNVSLTERCYLLLGRESPVASDLRFIVSVLRIVSELERVGDLALRVVKLSPKHELLVRSAVLFDILVTLADEAVEIYRVALRAWAAQDLRLATDLATQSRDLDLYYERLMSELKRLDGPDAVRDRDGLLLGRAGPGAHRRPRRDHRGAPALPHHRRARAPRRRGPVEEATMPDSRSTFHQQLDEVQRDLIRAAARVTEAIMRGTEALLTIDLAAAQELIDADDEIDALTLDIEERCFTILARQQPMASDMRAIVTAIRLTSEIERSGDLMVNVAKATRRLYGSEVPVPLRSLLQSMAERGGAPLRAGPWTRTQQQDADLAGALDDMDDRLDELHRDYIQTILEVHADVRDVQVAVQLALVGRYYERIGDHAVNIGERVQYMVTGWLPEHAGVARLAARSHADPAGEIEGA